MESIQTVKAALERRECPMREAMETALQDRTAAPAELTVTWEEVCRYLDSLAARGRRRETIQVYRPKLEAFYHFLPEDKRVAADTLELWRAALLREGYSPGTANTHVSAANGLLAYLGRRDLQLIGQLDTEGEIQPELSRTEYLRLLATARNLGRERTYLMVKVFALTGIRVSELNRVTVRAVEEGRVLTACDGRAQYVLIPACLRKELTVYLRRVGITAGPVFVTRSGRPMRRDPDSVQGCPGGWGQEQPPLSAQAVSGHAGTHSGQCTDTGRAGPRADAGRGAADCGLGAGQLSPAQPTQQGRGR